MSVEDEWSDQWVQEEKKNYAIAILKVAYEYHEYDRPFLFKIISAYDQMAVNYLVVNGYVTETADSDQLSITEDGIAHLLTSKL